MFKNYKLTTKIAILTLSILLLISVIFYINSEFILRRISNVELDDNLKELNADFINDNLSETQVLSISSSTLDSDQETKQLLIKQDREALYNHLLPIFNNINEKFEIDILEFYLPDGTNLLRMQAKNAFGDKGAHPEFFKKIKDTGEEASGLEFEYNGIALRVIRPYYLQGKLIGYVEIGENVTHLIDELKRRINNDYSVFMDKASLSVDNIQNIKKDPNFNNNIETAEHIELVNSGNNKLMKNCFSDQAAEIVRNKEYYTVKQLQDSGKTYICSAFNIKDMNGKHIAALISLSDITTFVSIVNINRLIIIGTLIISSLFFLAIIIYFIRRIILNPLGSLNKASEEIAKGNLNKKIEIRSSDEIGQLASSFDTMTDKLKESYENLENKIRERTTDLAKKTEQLENKNEESEEREQAILNIMDDLDSEKKDLERINAKDEAFLNNIGEGLIVTDQEGKVILASRVAQELTGRSLDQLVDKIWAKDFPIVEDEYGKQVPYEKTPVYGALHNKGTLTTKFFYKMADGKRFPALVTAAPVVIDGKNQGAVVVFRDITKEEEIDKAKSEFISLASHQLRTPLSAIKWFVELLGDTKNFTKEQAEFMNNISKATERMIELVNALLNISRIESGRITINPQPTDLAGLLQDIVKSMQHTVDERKLQLSINIDKDLPQVNVDQKMIKVVYENFLSNAIKYTPEGGQVSISVKKQNDEIISEVIDNGLGIPEKDYKRVFDKFFRGDNVIKVVPDGTGLGLYLTKSIIESSKGKIGFESKEGKGSKFWFSLPIAGMAAKKGEVTLS